MVCPLLLGEPIEIEQEILFGVKTHRAVVAALNDMQRNVRKDDAGTSWHSGLPGNYENPIVAVKTIVVCPLLLRARMSPESRDRAEAKAEAMLAEMPLNELRQARGLSQKMLAEVLHVQQPAIAKIEKGTDIYLSTLRSHIEAMGGELEIIARFPDGSVKISNFSELGKTIAA